MWETFIWVKLSGKENQLHLENQMQYFFFFGFRNKKNFLGEKHVHGWNKCMKKKSSREFFFHVMKSAILCQIFFYNMWKLNEFFFFLGQYIAFRKKMHMENHMQFFFQKEKSSCEEWVELSGKVFKCGQPNAFFFE